MAGASDSGRAQPASCLGSESHTVVGEGRLPVWVNLEMVSSSGPLLCTLSTWVTVKGMCALSQARPSVLSERMCLVHLPPSPRPECRALLTAGVNRCSPDRCSHSKGTDSDSN